MDLISQMDSDVVIDVHKFEKLNNLSINIFELNFYQDQTKWRHKLVPIEVSRNDSDRVIDLLFYYALIEKLNVFLGDHQKTFIRRRCLNSYTNEKMLKIYKRKCENNDTSTLRTSPEFHLHWKNHFHKKPLFFRIHADFEADNEKDNSSIGNETPNFYKQIPVCNGYRTVSEIGDVLKSGSYKSLLKYENVDWFLGEIIKSEKNGFLF